MKAVMKTRKSRNRTRRKKKPKYLSLLVQLSRQTYSPPRPARVTRQRLKQQQIIPAFTEDMHDDHGAMLFDTSTDNTVTSLQGILENATTSITTTEEREEKSSPYLCVDEGSLLVRTAMRCKERDASEEKWVFYAEVVEENKKEQEEEVSSFCCASTTDHQLQHHHDDCRWEDVDHQKRSGCGGPVTSLVLKLDYQEILNAWSDKGPPYVDEPVVLDLHPPNNTSTDCLGSVGNPWSVPEVGSPKLKVEVGAREVSMLRYKEKRQNRLFSKRIRYQVRKLNAEKRPRIKGRFVKRTGEDERILKIWESDVQTSSPLFEEPAPKTPRIKSTVGMESIRRNKAFRKYLILDFLDSKKFSSRTTFSEG